MPATSASYLRQYENDLVAYRNVSQNSADFYSKFCSVSGPNDLFWEEINKLRSKFHHHETADYTLIRPHILRSWKRSRDANASYTGMASVRLNNEELQVILERNEFLLSTARPIMDELFENIHPNANSIILTDAGGVYLHTIGDGLGFGRGSTCALRGLVSGESIEGTTSMGICLEEKEPVCVLGCEHYNPYFDGWSCSAAPIFDFENNMAGTLSLTIGRESFNHHTFGLILAAAKAISEQMRLRYLLQETQTIMELLGEAVVVLDVKGRVRMMNSYAKRLFHVTGDVISRDFSEIAAETGGESFPHSDSSKDNECAMRLADGTILQCLCSSSSTPEGGLCLTLRESRRVHRLTNRITRAKAVYTFDDIQGKSVRMQRALRLARKASENSMTTLILGESGVGKELFAQAIHNGSDRRDQPFIVINCGAIPRDLIQSELFGYESGAFTGAARQGAPGKFELADGGTLFLDEIGDMPLTAQVNLLRVLQEGEVTRVGGKRPRRVDVRVVAATHCDLARAVEDGIFRHDLYYRLNVLVINVPALRERRDDIPVLAKFFLAKIAKTLNKQLSGFTEETMKCLEAYNWPGNIRELENLVERTAVMTDGPSINQEDLLPQFWTVPSSSAHPVKQPIPENPASLPKPGATKSMDQNKQRIIEALQKAGGNVRAAAQDMGVARLTLYRHIRRHGISLELFRRQR